MTLPAISNLRRCLTCFLALTKDWFVLLAVLAPLNASAQPLSNSLHWNLYRMSASELQWNSSIAEEGTISTPSWPIVNKANEQRKQ